jgi:transposase
MRARPVYFMDETGIDHRLYRRDAWALRGERVTAHVSGSERRRTSVIGAWHEGAFLAPMVLEGSCDRHVMDCYFRDVLLPALPSGSVVVLDNASFHKASLAGALAHARGIELLYLPGYSPDINPIEHFWACLKTHLRNILPEALDKFQAICDACKFFCNKRTNVESN